MTAVYRFAPSPTGPLHDGHIHSAALNRFSAENSGGRYLVRIEDVDRVRCRPEHERAILAQLEAAGLLPAEPPLRQSEHFERYTDAARRLHHLGVLYPSRLSRGEVRRYWTERGMASAFDPDGGLKHPDTERENSADFHPDDEIAWRVNVSKLRALTGPLSWTEIAPDPEADQKARAAIDGSRIFSGGVPAGNTSHDPENYSDFAVIRKGGIAAYHLAAVLDDAFQGITHVVRGKDLYYQTSLHRLLQAALELPVPVYTHHALVLGADGKKLSKTGFSDGTNATP